MLIPLILLSVGAVAAGFVFAPHFIGHHEGEFWRGAIFTLPERPFRLLRHRERYRSRAGDVFVEAMG